jgi:predicted negative regulator of RcsB-dependent stress response
MSRSNTIYLIVGALVVVVAIMGYKLYQDRQKPGLNIDIGPKGVSVDKK